MQTEVDVLLCLRTDANHHNVTGLKEANVMWSLYPTVI